MAKKKIKRRTRKTTIPVAVMAGLAVGLSNPVKTALTGDLNLAAAQLSTGFTGYDPQTNTWKLNRMKKGILPVMVGAGVHKVAGKLGINRIIASTGIPWVRI